MKCENCGKPEPDIRYVLRDSEISTACCHAYVVNEDGSEFTEDQVEELLEAEAERIRSEAADE